MSVYIRIFRKYAFHKEYMSRLFLYKLKIQNKREITTYIHIDFEGYPQHVISLQSVRQLGETQNLSIRGVQLS